MTSPVVETRSLMKTFGGITATDNVTFSLPPGARHALIGPNGAGKTTVFNLISRIYNPTTGSISFEGQPLTQQPPHRIASLGIARTFQNIELFEHASVLHNLLIGRHTHRKTGLFADISIVHAWKGDTEGNLVYRKTARNFNPMMATASRMTIAEVEHLVPAGEIDPDCMHTPGIFVKRMVHVPNPVKHIEQRTTRKRAQGAPAGAGEEV